MKYIYTLLTCLILICPITSGCSGEATPKVPSSAEIIASFKANLKMIADTGEGGSGMDVLKTDFEELKKQAADKAQAVEKDFQSLLKAAKPEDRKSLATKIMNALE
ncbi:MAG: hypothetical protein ABIK07_17730 [Planctomycetota bacterium]|jgi:hypothetical protein|uniref:hypothetical protein n=1 Tax=uncultured Gimesia sp. TaxID=1678688 RepID=UPI002618C76B|nr:hypothetical protein [uncultured Gimesia sp.]